MNKFLNPLLVWIACITIFAVIFTQVDYQARENDSRLYTKDLIQLAKRPLSKLVVLQWEDTIYADPTSPYVRDHLIGQFIFPALMVKAGLPASHALYLFNNIIQIVIMYALFYLGFLFVGNYFPDVLFFVGILPQSWVYTLRANHEQPLALMGLLGMIAGIKLKQDKRWYFLALFSIIAAFLIKGIVFFMVPLAFVCGYLFSSGFNGKRIRDLVLYSIGISIVLALVVWSYEIWFQVFTGESFFKRYWEIQIHGRTLKADSGFSILTKLWNFYFYSSRTLAYILPWPLFFIGVFYKKRASLKDWYTANHRWFNFLGGYVLIYIITFSMFDRIASRYLYPNYYFAYLWASLALYKMKPSWSLEGAERSFLKKDSRRKHWIAAGIWLVLHFLKLGIYISKGGNGYWK